MIKRSKLLTIKSLCGILTMSSILVTSSPKCFASTTSERVNSLLQDIYSENSELKKQEKKY